ncbi:inner membrane protein [Paucibacter oligotrophus]|uniref:Inner membrane protein n=1 Tax=Roseateles oligotrophus TaxID=1769250 RepID=A0A840L3Q4_9BURK|nr:cell envelope integrity protein CreD [Roseateles oligotrophus]MBB4842586.1 inner membrane protein [Roseateles oligotrophus]
MVKPWVSKLLILAAVGFLLSLVLLRIGWLVDERQGRQAEAVQGVEESLAGAQTLIGPLLFRTCVETWEESQGEGKERRLVSEKREFILSRVPRVLQVGGQLDHEARYRGLFKVNAYAGRLQLDAQWASLDGLTARPEHKGGQISCGGYRVMLATSDVRGLRGVELRRGEQSLSVLPGTQYPSYRKGLHAELGELNPADITAKTPLALRLQLDLVGTQRFALVPAAQSTRLDLRSNWPHPSFGGRFLPNQREVGEQGFTAHWQVSELASTAAQAVQQAESAEKLEHLGFEMLDPVNPYVMSDRAIKYGLMFILLTFTCVGMVELLSGRRVHPVQYLLVGLAMSVFFLLLLSLSEHLSFAASYASAAAAALALLSFYGAHILGGWRRGLGFGAALGLLYGALYALLQQEQAALLLGSLLLFGVLAAVMVLTRKLDWYSLALPNEPAASR